MEEKKVSTQKSNAGCLFSGWLYLGLLLVFSPLSFYVIDWPIPFASEWTKIYLISAIWFLLLLGAPFMFARFLRNALDGVEPPFPNEDNDNQNDTK